MGMRTLLLMITIMAASCGSGTRMSRYYKSFTKKHADKFQGYRFLNDSIGDVRDLTTIIKELKYQMDGIVIEKSSVQLFNKQLHRKLKTISMTEFVKLPDVDSSVRFLPDEILAMNKIMGLNDSLIAEKMAPSVYEKETKVIQNGESLKNYIKKELLRKKMLVIFYPAIHYQKRTFIACRFYHTQMTSDAGSIVWQEF